MWCEFEEVFSFTYWARLDRGLIEHEFDHVVVAVSDQEPAPNPCEVAECRWVKTGTLRDEMTREPHRFTPWFRILLDPLLEAMRSTPPVPYHLTAHPCDAMTVVERHRA